MVRNYPHDQPGQAETGNPEKENAAPQEAGRRHQDSEEVMRMQMRRFTRLTNGFSKKVENHTAMVAIHFLNYNFIRRHQTIKAVPAVAAGVIAEPMKLEDLIALFDEFRYDWYPVNRPLHYRPRSNRETFEPQAPLTPWYLDPESGGPNPPLDQRKPGISYQDEKSSN